MAAQVSALGAPAIVTTKAQKLRSLVAVDVCHTVLGCHDAMSAKLIEEAGFPIAYFSGFSFSASRLAMPDIGVATYSEMVDAARACCDATSIPVIGDGDTGYGGVLNIRRTVEGYAAAGLAGICIEDQTFPKRCSYAKGAEVVPFEEALQRIKATVAARDEVRARGGPDLVIIARTDVLRAKAQYQSREQAMEEALQRVQAFQALKADVVYAEGLEGEEEMRRVTASVSLPTMLAQVERPGHAVISTPQAAALGFRLSLRGVTVLNAYMNAVRRTLKALKEGRELDTDGGDLMPFEELYASVGFTQAYEWEAKLD